MTEGSDCSSVEKHFLKKKKNPQSAFSLSHTRNINKSISQSMQRDGLSRLLVCKRNCCFVTRQEQSLCDPFICFFFVQKQKGNALQKLFFFD